MEDAMTDPRFVDPHVKDPNLSRPARDENAGSIWGWIAGFAVIALIAFSIIAGWNNEKSNGKPMPISLGNCKVTEVGDSRGSIILNCQYNEYTYTTTK